MTGDCPNMNENGHCSVHGVEIERRRATDKRLDEFKDDLDRHSTHIKDLFQKAEMAKEFRGQAKVVGVIGSLIFAGSYIFTHLHVQESDVIHAKIEAKVERNEQNINANKTDIALANERYNNILSSQNDTKLQVQNVNQRISQLVSILAEEGRIQRVRLEPNGHDQ